MYLALVHWSDRGVGPTLFPTRPELDGNHGILEQTNFRTGPSGTPSYLITEYPEHETDGNLHGIDIIVTE